MTSRRSPVKTLALLTLPAALLLAGAVHAQTLTTIAGSGINGLGEPMASNSAAQFAGVTSVLRTPFGGFFTAEFHPSRIRWIGDDGTTATVGQAGAGFAGDGGPISGARFHNPNSIILAPDSSVIVFDSTNNRIRRLDATNVNTIAGNGNADSSGDGGPATEAGIRFPTGGVYGPDGSLYVVEGLGHRVRKISPEGTISTVAGTGVAGFGGDGGPPSQAQLNNPRAIAIDRTGNLLYVTDQNRVRVINLGANKIFTLAGNGSAGSGGDGGWGTMAQLGGNWTDANGSLQSVGALSSIAVLSDGRVLVTDRANHKIRQITADYKISTYAGSGQTGTTGDAAFNGANGYYGGGELLTKAFNQPTGLSVDGEDNVYFSDFGNYKVRQFVSPANQFDQPATADGGVKWQRSVHPMTKARGCELVDIAQGPDDSISMTFSGPIATCTAPPQWAGAILAADIGPKEFPGFALRVQTLASSSVAAGKNTFVVHGRLAGYEEMIRDGTLNMGEEVNQAIEKTMEEFAASPEARIDVENERPILADGGASPANTFMREMLASITVEERASPWSFAAGEAANVPGTVLPPSAFSNFQASDPSVQQLSGQIAARTSANTVPPANRDESAALPFLDLMQRQRADDGELLAYDPLNLGYNWSPNGFVTFFYNKTDGAGIKIQDLTLSANVLGLTSPKPQQKEASDESKPVAPPASPPIMGGSTYTYGTLGGSVKIVEAVLAMKTEATSTAFGLGSAPRNKQSHECKELTGGWLVVPALSAFTAGKGIHACYVNKFKTTGRLVYEVTVKAGFGKEWEVAMEKPWVAAASPIPLFGTFTAGFWMGLNFSGGGMKFTNGSQRTFMSVASLNGGIQRVAGQDTGVKPAGPKATFQLEPNIKSAAYVQPFFMVSYAKIMGLQEGAKNITLPNGKPLPFINEFWSKKLSNASTVVKNGLLRWVVSSKLEAALVGTSGAPTTIAKVKGQACSSAGTRFDVLKGIIPGNQLQFSFSVDPVCFDPVEYMVTEVEVKNEGGKLVFKPKVTVKAN